MNFTHIMKECVGRTVSTVTKLRMIMCASDDESLASGGLQFHQQQQQPLHTLYSRKKGRRRRRKKKSPPTHIHTHTYIDWEDYEIKAPKTCWARAFWLGNIILTPYSLSLSMSPLFFFRSLATPLLLSFFPSPVCLYVDSDKRRENRRVSMTHRRPPRLSARCCGECGFPVTDPLSLSFPHLFNTKIMFR